MWNSKGRSGYGDSTLQGDYNSWDGISPNGRQYRNEITQETRDLSGSDYWHLRKQNRPDNVIPESMHMLNKDRANIQAYADKEPVKKASSVSIKDRILPQSKRLITLRSQMIELENEYRTTGMTIEEYTMLRDVIVCKIDRAQVLYLKASSVKPIRNDEETDEFNGENGYESCATDYSHATLPTQAKDSFVDQLSHTNIFRAPLQKGLHISKKLVQFMKASKRYIKTLSEV